MVNFPALVLPNQPNHPANFGTTDGLPSKLARCYQDIVTVNNKTFHERIVNLSKTTFTKHELTLLDKRLLTQTQCDT